MTNKSRSRYSLLNAMSAIGLTLVNGLLGIVVTRLVIAQFGSDFNGLNSTANQIVNVLLIMEGSFTLASNVALFSPLTNQNYETVNGILSATRQKFRRVGIAFLLVGFATAVVYSLAANSALPREFIATVIVMAIVPQAFNLFYASTYRVLLQAQQKEYIISFITMLTIGLGHAANIVMILRGGQMWMVRFITMLCALLNSLMIAVYVKKRNSCLDLHAQPLSELINGTTDIMIQKITGVIYNSAPIVFLSISSTGGTVLASVYAVYNNVFIMIKSLLHGIIDAPRLGIGQMLTERKREEIWPVFIQYEYVAFLAIFTLLTTACTLILPFIRIYMDGITDANYYDRYIALLMVLISTVEMMHIPSGHLINMAGEFAVSKKFQIISCATLLVAMFIGGSVWGIYGMLLAVLFCAIELAFLEMGYIHTHFFIGKLWMLLKKVLPLALFGPCVCYFELLLALQIIGYTSFFLYGVLLVILNGLIALSIGALFNRTDMKVIFDRTKGLLKRGKAQ